ncbi:16S rRNA (guanine(966)-N(2))-methyltransferase RsmD [Marinimicrobium alkaliphilum]|uniref:16S rRNA (guanine(966)-N(2))-methyltransferase RsmD n=1 Tax=Marinimicrobium alkaliphilum TaxID=2202654 RepID=UPI000DBA7FF4|nr:16S rRNA (guanine(966)-N(2))-methyltransferase RsmD [Marinimicrobium alkaliphilum]
MKASAKANKQANQIRIIGGQWRGRKLHFPDVEGLRPTGDRVRETLFNWLMPHLPEARCLDLFAGSGALGLEALSRGASEVTLVERDRQASAQLRANLEVLGSQQGKVIQADVLGWLALGNPDAPYDVVFVDPPFSLTLWQPVIDALSAGGWLAPEAAIYVESGRRSDYQVPADWALHRDKHAGQVSYRLYFISEAQ